MKKHTYLIEEKVSQLVNEMTVDEKISLLSTSQSEIKRLGIQEYHVGGEAAHGVVDRSGGKTTSFPQPLGLSQTWNPELLKEIGTAIGKEARILYQQSDKKSWLTLWAPTIDMERDPRWGRNEEAYGEDPYLTGQLSVGLIQGMQGDDPEWIQLAAAPKHFYGNNNEYLRESSSNSIDPRNREEYYLKAFEPAFTEANAQSMMTAYNGINGVPGMQHEDIEKIVRNRWEMEGFIVSDGGALTLNVENYHYYDTFEEALAESLKKGIDCFVDEKELVESAAKKALEKGYITEKDVTRAIKRTLTVRARLGHFEESIPFDEVNQELLAGEKHAELVRKATAEQTVLLKNKDILPLAKDQKVLLTGPLSDVWLRDWYGGYPTHEITIKDGLTDELSESQFVFSPAHDDVYMKVDDQYIGLENDYLSLVSSKEDAATFSMEDWDFGSHLFKEKKTGRYVALDETTNTYKLNKTEVYDWFVKENWIRKNELDWQTWNNQPIGITKNGYIGAAKEGVPIEVIKTNEEVKRAAEKAEEADICVVAIGNHPMLNGKETMDRPGMRIPESQLKMVQELYGMNPNIVVIVVGSYPFEMEWINEHVPGILFTTHGSQELGKAMADILYHKVAPTGKLSQNWYENTAASLPTITDYDIIKGKRTYRYTDKKAAYPFGHGLTYGKLSIVSAQLSKRTWGKKDAVHVTVELKNEAEYVVTDTLQCYASLNPEQEVLLPKKQLLSFSKITLQPQESRKIEMVLDVSELSFWDVAWDRWVFPTAQGKLHLGFSSSQIEQSLPFRTSGEVRRERDFSTPVHVERYDDYHKAFITIDSAKEKVVSVDQKGWLGFCNVHFKQLPAKLSIQYSAEEEGELHVYKDSMLQTQISSVHFERGVNKKLVVNVDESEYISLFLSPTVPIMLKTIQEFL